MQGQPATAHLNNALPAAATALPNRTSVTNIANTFAKTFSGIHKKDERFLKFVRYWEYSVRRCVMQGVRYVRPWLVLLYHAWPMTSWRLVRTPADLVTEVTPWRLVRTPAHLMAEVQAKNMEQNRHEKVPFPDYMLFEFSNCLLGISPPFQNVLGWMFSVLFSTWFLLGKHTNKQRFRSNLFK